MHYASTGKAHEFRVQVGQGLCQIFAQAMSLIGVLWHERHHVGINLTFGQCQYLQYRLFAALTGREHSAVLFPVGGSGFHRCLGEQFGIFSPSLRLHKCHPDLFGIAAHIAQENGEIVFLARFD